MKILRAVLLALLLPLGLVGDEGCSPRDAQTVKNVTEGILRGSDIACMLRSTLVSIEELAGFCELAQPLSPVIHRAIEDLVGAREAGRRAGWRPRGEAVDAGSDAR